MRARRVLSAVVLTLVGVGGCLDAPEDPVGAPPSDAALAPVGAGFVLNASDLRFFLQQIKIAENHSAGGELLGPGPNQVGSPMLPFGLRTVDGSFNNLVPGQSDFGKSDRLFPRLVPGTFRQAESGTAYTQKKGLVIDSRPRLVSNLIVDQTPANPSAAAAAGPGAVPDASGTLFIPNVAPDVGLSAPYNSMFTLFGQFFDHGLDLVTKGGGTVFVPLRTDDPLYVAGSPTNFMVLTRATNQPGPDGVVGDDPSTPEDESLDDIQEATNRTTPFVDQNQTYTSQPSHQVFLREYVMNALNRPVSTGRLIDGAVPGNIGNWSEVKAQARDLLGIELEDIDVLAVPLLVTDPYGYFERGPHGFPMVVFPGGITVEGNPLAPIPVEGSLKAVAAFLDDIAHHAAPFGDHDNNPATPPQALVPDSDPGFTDDHDPNTYDDELLDRHFVTGDGRGNENIGLTSVHTVFHSEHNRLAADIDELISKLTPAEIAEWHFENPDSGWDYGERLFQAARFVTEMEYQHLVFEEFARKVQPMINVFAGYHTEIDPAIVAEFAHTVYRFGHSLLTETVARINEDGTPNDIALLDAFLNPVAFNDGGGAGVLDASQAAGSIFQGMTDQVGNELDEFITEALRNRLLGLPLDLATINMSRSRSEGVPTLNEARRQFYADTGDPWIVPYESWADLSFNLKHEESLVNYIAAFGKHASITGSLDERRAAAMRLVANDPSDPLTPPDSVDFIMGINDWANVDGRTITGVDDIDFWVGGLGERQAPFGGLLGATFNFVFERQLEKLQDGDRFYYLARTAGLNLLVQLEGNSFAELVMRNTTAERLPADVFSRPDFLFKVANLGTSGPVPDDPSTTYDESEMLVRMPNGTLRYGGEAHVNWAGSNDPGGIDRMHSSEGDDTMRGNGGIDFMEAGAGNDNLIGGEGNDVLTDAFGDDVLKGGPGNDTLSSGVGFDLNQGGTGNDFIIGGSDPTETFGGPGNDMIFAGDSADTIFGDDGDDWIEGGGQADLLQGDNGAPFQNDPNQPGNDVIIGDGGDDDYDSEGGDDIMVSGPGIERNEGMFGFDWVTARGDPQPMDADMRFIGLLPPDIDAIRDRFDMVEALSGWNFDDVLRGDDRPQVEDNPAIPDFVGHELTPEGIDRIAGLEEILRGATTFAEGNILLGGGGSDILEGRAGNDILDGDRWLNVQLRAPNLATVDPSDTKLVDSTLPLRADMLAGRMNGGQVSIARSLATTGVMPGDIDIAVFSGARAEYLVTLNADGSVIVDHQGGIDGIDTLWNIELLQFLDGTVPVPDNASASGTLALSTLSPIEDGTLTVTPALTDPDGINAATLQLIWQAEIAADVWEDVEEGTSFTPDDDVVGLRLRVLAIFFDNAVPPTQETVLSEVTGPVQAVNDPATGLPTLSLSNPVVGGVVNALTAGIADLDGLGTFSFQWLANGTPIALATTASFTPTAAQLGTRLSVRVSFTDGQGFSEVLTSAESGLVATNASGVAGVPTTVNFGRRRIDTTRTQSVSVTNQGTTPLTVSSAATSGAPFSVTLGTCTAPVAPGGRCRLLVSFTPAAAQAYAGTLVIISSATNSPSSVLLTGTGR